jgi:hypothetical protein
MAKMTKYERLCDELCKAWQFTIAVEEVSGRLELTAIAPAGKYFATEGLHEIVECQTDEPADEVWARLHERILDGFADCKDGGCNRDCELAMLS